MSSDGSQAAQERKRARHLARLTAAEAEQAKGHQWTPLQTAVVELYARGHTRRGVAAALVDRIVARDAGSRAKRLAIARAKIRNLERQPWFRDKLWELAVVRTDLALNEVLDGVTREAKRGRVEAAKLVLDVTGRHSQHGEPAPSNIQVHFGYLPRPERAHLEIEGVLLDEDDE
jgi:hypothetical protein